MAADGDVPPMGTGDPAVRCRFAVVGDVHGQFCSLISLIRRWERGHALAIDLVLQVGELEAHRDVEDVSTMAAPSKHRALGDFHRVLAGELQLPWPVYFIGGNHEPYGWLEGHPEGFELCHNLHYLGRAGVRSIGHLRVAAISGIHRLESYGLARPELSDWQRQRDRAATGDVRQWARGRRISNKDFVGFTGQEVGHVMAGAAEEDVRWRLGCTFASLCRAGSEGEHGLDREQLRPLAAALRPSDPDGEAQRLLQKIVGESGEGRVSEESFVSFFLSSVSNMSEAKRAVFLQRLQRVQDNSSLVDVLMTHDWPGGIVTVPPELRRARPVGNEQCQMLMDEVKPALMVCGHMHTAYRARVGGTLVRCLAKVPSVHSLAVFEMRSRPREEDAGQQYGMWRIREVDPCDPLPAPHFAAEDSDIDSDEG